MSPIVDIKSNIHCTRSILSKLVTSGEAHLHCLEPELQNSRKRRSDDEPLAIRSGLTGTGIDPRPIETITMFLITTGRSVFDRFVELKCNKEKG